MLKHARKLFRARKCFHVKKIQNFRILKKSENCSYSWNQVIALPFFFRKFWNQRTGPIGPSPTCLLTKNVSSPWRIFRLLSFFKSSHNFILPIGGVASGRVCYYAGNPYSLPIYINISFVALETVSYIEQFYKFCEVSIKRHIKMKIFLFVW